MPYLNLTGLKEIEPAPSFKGRFAHSDHVTMAYWNIAAGAALPQHADALKRRIDETDAAIDAAVYRLYDLSAEEIRVVEGKEEAK